MEYNIPAFAKKNYSQLLQRSTPEKSVVQDKLNTPNKRRENPNWEKQNKNSIYIVHYIDTS